MGQLAFGLAGAVAGFFLGGPTGAMIGWTLASLAWSLLDPPKVQGPRLNDTKIRGADYGQMRPILYGMARIGGLGMGQGSVDEGLNKFTEHEEKSSGKGGPEVTNYRYTLSFFNEICEGVIVGVNRRWVNAKLWTEPGEARSDRWPYRLYVGDALQNADPTMETIYGVGEVAPMRGVAHEAIEELDLTDWGNARPNVEYEAYTKGGDIPWRVSTFNPWPQGSAPFARTEFAATLVDGVITTTQIARVGGTVATFYVNQFDIYGNQIGVEVVSDVGMTASYTGMVGNHHVIVITQGSDFAWWQLDFRPGSPYFLQYLAGAPINPISYPQRLSGNWNLYMDGRIYYIDSNTINCIVGWVEADGTIPTGVYGSTYDLGDNYTASNVAMSVADGYVYILAGTVIGVVPPGLKLWQLDRDLNLVTFWDLPYSAPDDTDLVNNAGNFHVFNGYLAYHSTPQDDIKVVRLETGSPPSVSDYGSSIPGGLRLHDLGGGLGLDDFGVYSLVPPPAQVILGDIVADLCERSGTSQYDVSDLTQEVRGYIVAAQMTTRNAIDTLRKGFFFDATEYDGKLVFRNRGHAPTETIPDGDLCAHVPGTDPPEPLDVVRVPEQELPRTVFINFYNFDNDYQQGSQYWRRTVTLSQSDVTLDLPIVFTPNEALLRAQLHMHFAWLERDHFTFYVTEQWCRLRPTDCVVVRGVALRLTNVTESPNGIIKCEGVRAFAGPFTGHITDPIDGDMPGDGGGGQPPQDPPMGKADTGIILIDAPWTSEADSPTALRAAVYKSTTGSWSGASVYKSVDDGTTYASVASTSSESIIGTVATAIGTFAGGNVVDEGHTLRVVLTNTAATLSSTTEAGLLNGINLAAYGTPTGGWEMIQFRTATLVSAGVYDLTGLLRYRFGTEWVTHAANDSFVLWSSTIEVPGIQATLLLALKYKAVTFGTAIADATVVTFTNTGVALKPLSPVLLGGGRDASSNLSLNWIPRRRGSGGWPNGVDLPPTESPEAYIVTIYTTSGYTTSVRTIGVGAATTTTYSAAQQTTDFGSPQATVYWDVVQAGAAGYGYAARGAT